VTRTSPAGSTAAPPRVTRVEDPFKSARERDLPDFWAYYLERPKNRRATLIVASARPEFLERRPGWISDDPGNDRLDLAPLGQEATFELADVLLQKLDEVADSLRQIITTGADGNPFFLEELVKMMLDGGVIIADDDGSWQGGTGRVG
jgi:hypothetical protein